MRSNEGRPTKVEGNPDHPSNLGCSSTDIFAQASILTLYDPDRSQTPLYRGETRAWTAFVAEIRAAITAKTEPWSFELDKLGRFGEPKLWRIRSLASTDEERAYIDELIQATFRP